MRNQKEKKRLHRIAAAGLVVMLGLGMTMWASATEAEAKSTGQETSGSLAEAQKEKEALEQELARAEETIRELKNTQGDIQDKVSELNGQLLNISERITSLENQLAEKNQELSETQEQIEQTQEKLADARADEKQQYEDMKVRIQFMYENGQNSYLEAFLTAGNISEFLNSVEYISEIQSYDRQKLTEYQETVAYIEGVEEQLNADYAALEEMKASVEQEKASVEEQKASVASLMQQKESELASLEGNISDAQSEADYYAAEIQAQEEIIAEIKRIEAEKAAAGTPSNPYTGGAFTWPCPSSTRITSDYGTRVSPTSGASSNHKGIDIGAAGGADIVAAANGTVTTAAYSSSAGNYVMIDHGGGLYTVYMHASALLVSPGQTVSAGEVIAKVGSTGISTGNHLHFGVSLNGSYVSPWSYLGG